MVWWNKAKNQPHLFLLRQQIDSLIGIPPKNSKLVYWLYNPTEFMKKLKEIELRPLTDFEDLQLKIVGNKNYDLTSLGDERNGLLAHLFRKIQNIPGVIMALKRGDEKYIVSQVKGSKDKKKVFMFPEPNPVCIYYSTANEHLERSYGLKNQLFREEQHFNGNYHYENFIEYYQVTSQGIILLIAAVEGFVNQLLPDSFQMEIEGDLKNKEKIEWLDLNKKVRLVIPALNGIDFQKAFPLEYDKIFQAVELRNDLIHLKRSEEKNRTQYRGLFKRLLDFEHIGCSDSVFTFMNAVVPGYLVEKPQP